MCFSPTSTLINIFWKFAKSGIFCSYFKPFFLGWRCDDHFNSVISADADNYHCVVCFELLWCDLYKPAMDDVKKKVLQINGVDEEHLRKLMDFYPTVSRSSCNISTPIYTVGTERWILFFSNDCYCFHSWTSVCHLLNDKAKYVQPMNSVPTCAVLAQLKYITWKT